MEIWEVDKLVLFLIFFIPGFISIKIYNSIIPTQPRDSTIYLLDAIGFSALNFAAMSWLILIIHSNGFYKYHSFWYSFLLLFILLVAPIIWPFVIKKLRTWKPLAKIFLHPIGKPWDYVFGKKSSFWVIIHLKDGRSIGGKFDTESFASSFPSEEQIYLEEVWYLENKKFKNPIPRSKGIIVLKDEISSIEFFN